MSFNRVVMFWITLFISVCLYPQRGFYSYGWSTIMLADMFIVILVFYYRDHLNYIISYTWNNIFYSKIASVLRMLIKAIFLISKDFFDLNVSWFISNVWWLAWTCNRNSREIVHQEKKIIFIVKRILICSHIKCFLYLISLLRNICECAI